LPFLIFPKGGSSIVKMEFVDRFESKWRDVLSVCKWSI